MKLKSPDWKTAWFENHISDRFFQEMAKLDKGTAKTLEQTAQWMNQMMVETGYLAQTMNALEEDTVPTAQIRVAADKALRLAAMAVHLMTALDSAHREGDYQGGIVYQGSRHPLPTPARTGPEESAGSRPGQSQDERPWDGAQNTQNAGMPSFATHPLGGASPLAAQMLGAKGAPSGGKHSTGETGNTGNEPMQAQAGAPDANFGYPGEALGYGMDHNEEVPLLSPFLDDSQAMVEGEASPMRATIASLHQQGLSRAEIEVITGQPRHIVEAVIDNEKKSARKKAAEKTAAGGASAGKPAKSTKASAKQKKASA